VYGEKMRVLLKNKSDDNTLMIHLEKM
jgi:hypothetical protein